MYHMWASKFASGHSAISQIMAWWKKWDLALCPLCQLTKETTLHVLQCSHPECTSAWHQSIESFCSWMSLANTSPAIIQCFSTTLHTQGMGSFTSLANSSCWSAASLQSEIGVFHMLLGCLSPHWEVAQAAYWSNKQCQWSTRHWAQNLCLQLLTLTHSTWLARNQLLQE